MKKAVGVAAVILALMAAIPGAAAQGMRACTQIGCHDGLTLNIDQGYRWQPGAYVFQFTLDGRAVTCTGSLPLNPCGQPSIHCNAPGIMIGESGCALPPQSHGFSTIHIDSAPKDVSVEITSGGRTITDQHFTPAYRTSRPNGPQCEPVCHSSSESLSLR